VARHADHLAGVAHAAVDRRDDRERQVERVQDRALLDVQLDEAEVARRIATQRRDRCAVQSRSFSSHRAS
jgi:hypothetical protein